MDKALNREVLRLSLPSIFANLTIPLVGIVDTAIAGHIGHGSAAVYIAAISLGSLLFNLLYWNFAFLRTGTGGLTAQAYGRGDMHDCAAILTRGLALSFLIAAVILAIQWPFAKLVLSLTEGSPSVKFFAEQYFFIRIWAAPATLGLMAVSGWFVGMQDSMSSMWKDLIVNGVNILASAVLSLGIGTWEGLGFMGIALGTVIAQYCGLFYCLLVCFTKYRKKVFSGFKLRQTEELLKGDKLRSFFVMNSDLFVRSLCFCGIYLGYTYMAATMGDVLLACSSIMMQTMMIFSYVTDGFAYAGEALTGRFIGEKDEIMLRRSILYGLVWTMLIGLVFILIYLSMGMPMLKFLTNDALVIDTCRKYLPWLVLMPIGGAAFFLDGVFLGATSTTCIRNSMIGATLLFFAVWFSCKSFVNSNIAAFHLLLAAYYVHLFFRSFYMSGKYLHWKKTQVWQ